MKTIEKKLIGKMVVITGASSGIGEATAITLAYHGAKVLLGARRKDKLETLTEHIKKSGGKVTYSLTDVKNKEDLLRLVRIRLRKPFLYQIKKNNLSAIYLKSSHRTRQ